MSVRNPGLDVVRSVAIVCVFLCHLLVRWAILTGRPVAQWYGSLGSYGVELFFALSGYLIGRQLLAMTTWREIRTFMVRRWKRTLPLYWAVLAFLLIFCPPGSDIAGHVLRFLTFTQALGGIPTDGWFSVAWSLSVEEWFYLLFPVVLLLLRSTVLTLGLFMLLPLLARIFLCSHPMAQATPFVVDSIAYGVALASAERRGWGMLKAPVACGILGLTLSYAAWATCLLPGLVPEWSPLHVTIAGIGAALTVAAALGLRLPSLAARGARWVSDHSFSIYLVHNPIQGVAVILFTDGTLSLGAATALSVLATVAVSTVTRRWIEVPGMARWFPSRRLSAVSN